MITIDNVTYSVGIIKITRTASQDVESLGKTLDLRKHYDIKGTYYNYEVELATNNLGLTAYDELYEVLTTPTESHIVTLPYAQSNITFEARVSVASDSLVKNFQAFKKWGSIKVTFEALTPQKEA